MSVLVVNLLAVKTTSYDKNSQYVQNEKENLVKTRSIEEITGVLGSLTVSQDPLKSINYY